MPCPTDVILTVASTIVATLVTLMPFLVLLDTFRVPVPLMVKLPFTWMALASSPLVDTVLVVPSTSVIMRSLFLLVLEMAIPLVDVIVALLRKR